jgi:hypothetical protein
VILRKWLAAAAIAAGAVLTTGTTSPAAEPQAKPVYSFATLRAVPLDVAKAKATQWLVSVGHVVDPSAVDAIWVDAGRSILDMTVETLAMGNPEIGVILAEAKDPDAAAPVELPTFIKDPQGDRFFRANVATAYAKALATKRVYEESLDALKAVSPEECVEPATYYFYKAVAEHALMLRESAVNSITRLLDDVADTPDRYRMVATLMFFDIQNWSPDQKDLANIGRLMDNSGRRLDLARGGPQTQDIQKKIVFRLDEVIKELENRQKNAQCNGGNCPSGGIPGSGGNTINPSGPAADSTIMGGSGPGKVDEKKLKKLAEEWGKLPQSERAKAIQEITRDLPPKYKPMIEEYFKSLNRLNGLSP